MASTAKTAQKVVKVLVVEDSPTQLEALRFVLAEAGFSVVAAANGKEALAAAKANAFDLVISDIVMPEMDGYALCRALRADETLRHLPMILLTSLTDPQDVIRGLESGANNLICKPYDGHALLARVQNVLANQEIRKASPSEMGISIVFAGQRFFITADRLQILDLLLSTYENAVNRNSELIRARDELRTLNEHLETRVAERTAALTTEIEERKRTEERLWMMAQMLNVAPAAIVVHDMEGRILYGNRNASELHGCSPEELLDLNMQDQLPADDPLFLTRVQRIRDAGQASFEVAHLRKDGSTVPLHVQAHITEWEGKPAILSVQMDLTERRNSEKALREAEEQFRQVQKLEAIGQLAGGVAHDFNNILMAQLGYCERMRSGLRAEDPLARDLAQIKACAERAAGLTRQLLAFSRKQTLQPRVLDLNAVVGDIEKMLRRLIGEDIDFVTKLAADLGRVQADPGQIEQVLMNLVVNARDAMPDGGKLTIETANVDLDAEYARSHVSVVPGRYVMFAVSDTGCGMDAATQSRVFEPFFTTKGKEKGTGLGLSTVYGIVNQSGGNIWVYSELGKGTSFKIFLPRVDAEPTSQADQAVEVVRGNGELVLVVEDEPSIQDLMVWMLENLGYRPKVAANGGEALIAIEEQGLKPDLLITDVVMPGMSGKVLAERLRKTQPDLKVLFMSGYTDDAIVHHGVLDPGTPFLEKPFNMGTLAGKVRELLRVRPEPRVGRVGDAARPGC